MLGDMVADDAFKPRFEKIYESVGKGGLTVYERSLDGKWTYYYAHLASYAPGLAEGIASEPGNSSEFSRLRGHAPRSETVSEPRCGTGPPSPAGPSVGRRVRARDQNGMSSSSERREFLRSSCVSPAEVRLDGQ